MSNHNHTYVKSFSPDDMDESHVQLSQNDTMKTSTLHVKDKPEEWREKVSTNEFDCEKPKQGKDVWGVTLISDEFQNFELQTSNLIVEFGRIQILCINLKKLDLLKAKFGKNSTLGYFWLILSQNVKFLIKSIFCTKTFIFYILQWNYYKILPNLIKFYQIW